MFLRQIPTSQTLHEIPEGRRGIAATLDLMSRCVKQYKTHPVIRDTALELTQSLSNKDYPGEVRRLYEFVRDEIRYVRDIHGVETLYTPDQMLVTRAGDCDDKSLLLATLLESIGHPTRFVAMGFAGGDLEHVLPETKIGQKWIPLETTEDVELGWTPKNVTNVLIRHN